MDYDYLPVSNGSGDAALMTIETDRLAGVATIDVDTIVNVPTKFIGTWGTLGANNLITPSTKRDFKGRLVDLDVVIEAMETGSVDNGNTAGQVIIIKPNSSWSNRIASFVKNATGFGTPEALSASTLTTSGNATVGGNATVTGNLAVTGTIPSARLFNPYKFHVYCGANWTDGNNAFAVAPLNVKTFDTNNNWSTVDFSYTAPVNGYYQFSGCVRTHTKNGAGVDVVLLKNSLVIIPGHSDVPVGYDGDFQQGKTVAGLIYLTAGDVIKLASYGGGYTALGGTNSTFLSGFLVSTT